MDYPVRLSEDERFILQELIQNEQVPDHVAVVAMLLLRCDETIADLGHNSIRELSRVFGCRELDVLTVKRLYGEGGILLALTDDQLANAVGGSVTADGQLGLFEGQMGVWEDQTDPLEGRPEQFLDQLARWENRENPKTDQPEPWFEDWDFVRKKSSPESQLGPPRNGSDLAEKVAALRDAPPLENGLKDSPHQGLPKSGGRRT